MFVRVKTVKGKKYFYLIENKRIEGKRHPAQRVIEYLGNQDAAIATLEASSYPDKERLLERVLAESPVGQAHQKTDNQVCVSDERSHPAPLPQANTNSGSPKSAQKQEGDRPDPWDELNERQRQYLEAIYRADQAAEQEEASRWKRGIQRRPADVGALVAL